MVNGIPPQTHTPPPLLATNTAPSDHTQVADKQAAQAHSQPANGDQVAVDSTQAGQATEAVALFNDDKPFGEMNAMEQVAFLKANDNVDNRAMRLESMSKLSEEQQLVLFNALLVDENPGHLLAEVFTVLPPFNVAAALVQLEMIGQKEESVLNLQNALTTVAQNDDDKAEIVAELQKLAADPANAGAAEMIKVITGEVQAPSTFTSAFGKPPAQEEEAIQQSQQTQQPVTPPAQPATPPTVESSAPVNPPTVTDAQGEFAKMTVQEQAAFLQANNGPESTEMRFDLMGALSNEQKLLLFNQFLMQDNLNPLLLETYAVLPIENAANSLVQLEMLANNPELPAENRQAMAQLRGVLTAAAGSGENKEAIIAHLQTAAKDPQNAAVVPVVNGILAEMGAEAVAPPQDPSTTPAGEATAPAQDPSTTPTGEATVPTQAPETPATPDYSAQLSRLEELASQSFWNPMTHMNAAATLEEMQQLVQTIVTSSDEDVQKMANILGQHKVELLQPLLTNQATPGDAVAKILASPDFPVGNFMDKVNDAHAYTTLYRTATAGTVEQATTVLEKTVAEYDRFWDREAPIKQLKTSLVAEDGGKFWNRLPEGLRKKIDDLLK